MAYSKTPYSSKTGFFWASLIAVLASVLNHAYLLKEHYDLRYGEASGSSLCNINELFSCAAVSASRFAELGGVPVALWGLAANLVLAILMGLYFFSDDMDRTKKNAARRNLLLVAGAIALASIVMGVISTFILTRLCPFCILAYVLSFITFGTLWVYLQAPDKKNSLPSPSTGFTPLAILSGVALVGVFVTHQQALMHYKANMLGPIVQESLESWKQQSPRQIDTTDALVFGASDEKAKMVITEFADYRCIHCKHAAPVLKAFVTAHAEDVRLQFMAWPLDGECNASIPQANGTSCMLARAVYCVEKGTGQGWKAQAYVFEKQDQFHSKGAVQALLPEIAKAGGMEPKDIETCIDSPEAKAAIDKQAAVGSSLNLRGTPAIFVNGKNLNLGQRIQTLEEVYRILSQEQK